MAESQPLLEVSNLKVYFRGRSAGTWSRAGGEVRAVDGVSLTVRAGETLGLVGESGCGKSTLARAVLRLVPSTAGSIRFDGEEVTRMSHLGLRALRPRMQLVFQDAGSALNPRWRVRQLIAEPLEIHRGMSGRVLGERVDRLLETVGLDIGLRSRRPRQLSGGQRQRVGIARALALEPDLLICDEPTSALDLSIQAQIVELLLELQQRLSLSYLFITHNLGVVQQVSDRVAVMYLGKIVEAAPAAELFTAPQHPYTRALLAAVPVPDPRRARAQPPVPLAGEAPSPANPPRGCSFCTRCPDRERVLLESGVDCSQVEPATASVSDAHTVRCHLHAGGGLQPPA